MALKTRGLVAASLTAVIAVVIVLLTQSGPGPTPRPPPAPPARPAVPQPAVSLGANSGRLFNGGFYSAGFIAAQLQALERTGATLARSDAQWEVSEPRPPTAGVHHYDWSFDDTIAGQLAAHRLRWLPIVDYTPSWARSIPGADHSPPHSPSDYAAYAAALAGRYGVGGSFWRNHPELPALAVDTYEIWNEPDNPAFWRPRPNATAYVRLYAAARAAILAVQPDAVVIVGGLTNPAAFLPQMLAADPGLGGGLGGVGIHPYAATPDEVLAKVRSDRQLLQSLGLGTVPLYVTEVGWTTSPPGALDYAPAAARPGYIYSTVTSLTGGACGVSSVLLYAWFTPARDPADPQDWFGIDDAAATGGPDVSAFTAALRARSSGARC